MTPNAQVKGERVDELLVYISDVTEIETHNALLFKHRLGSREVIWGCMVKWLSVYGGCLGS